MLFKKQQHFIEAFESIKVALKHSQKTKEISPELHTRSDELNRLLRPASDLALKISKFDEAITLSQKSLQIL